MKMDGIKQYLLFLPRISAFTLLLFFLNSCEVINPSEPIPSYIHLDSCLLETTYGTEGTALSNYTDAWVYVNGIYLGTFEYPFTIPVLEEGENKISIRPGIQDNGISGIRAIYTKTKTFDTIVNLQPNVTNNLRPKVSYLTGTVFSQLEDFDDGNLTLVPTTSNSALFEITPGSDPNALEGNSAHITLDINHPDFEYASSNPFVLPTNVPVYIELNYKCSQEFSVGVFITSSSGVIQSPVISIRPSSEWKKIYINLSDGGGIFQTAINYKIYLKSSLTTGSSQAEVYLDNLKVLY